MTHVFFRRRLMFSLLAMAATLAACASGARTEGTGEYLDDSVITTKVKAAVLADAKLKSLQIGVETFKGRVQLSGFVNNHADVAHAAEVARGVKGVSGVINDLQVK